jgi:hypothetical protein
VAPDPNQPAARPPLDQPPGVPDHNRPIQRQRPKPALPAAPSARPSTGHRQRPPVNLRPPTGPAVPKANDRLKPPAGLTGPKPELMVRPRSRLAPVRPPGHHDLTAMIRPARPALAQLHLVPATGRPGLLPTPPGPSPRIHWQLALAQAARPLSQQPGRRPLPGQPLAVPNHNRLTQHHRRPPVQPATPQGVRFGRATSNRPQPLVNRRLLTGPAVPKANGHLNRPIGPAGLKPGPTRQRHQPTPHRPESSIPVTSRHLGARPHVPGRRSPAVRRWPPMAHVNEPPRQPLTIQRRPRNY